MACSSLPSSTSASTYAPHIELAIEVTCCRLVDLEESQRLCIMLAQGEACTSLRCIHNFFNLIHASAADEALKSPEQQLSPKQH